MRYFTTRTLRKPKGTCSQSMWKSRDKVRTQNWGIRTYPNLSWMHPSETFNREHVFCFSFKRIWSRYPMNRVWRVLTLGASKKQRETAIFSIVQKCIHMLFMINVLLSTRDACSLDVTFSHYGGSCDVFLTLHWRNGKMTSFDWRTETPTAIFHSSQLTSLRSSASFEMAGNGRRMSMSPVLKSSFNNDHRIWNFSYLSAK